MKISPSARLLGRMLCVGATFFWSSLALAQGTGQPPDDAKALVDAPKGPAVPDIKKPDDGSNLTVSLGAQWISGNSSLLAATANGAFETRFDDNGIGAYLLGNYGQGAPPGQPIEKTAENIQGRIRYDRFLLEQLSVFVINTGRHDKFQGLAFRYNLDPGVRYLFLSASANALWAEVGYDFQDEELLDSARVQPNTTVLLPGSEIDHSARVFVGYRHSFNKEVTLTAGLEYLQSFVHGENFRFNGDALFAAKIGWGLAFGVGVSLRYDHHPLPEKKDLDTATTLSLIYAFSDTPDTVATP